MRVLAKTNETDSRGVLRVVDALERYHPNYVEIVDTQEEADLIIFHVIGRRDGILRRIKQANKPYAIIQYAYKSTLTPNPGDWKEIWDKAVVVWSYYHLPIKNLYHAPLGTDFHISLEQEKEYVIATSGLSYLTESVRECVLAARAVKGKVFHVGPELNVPDVVCSDGMSDGELQKEYAKCQFVSGLRRVEGFEFPVIEGLMCGARPIVFDRAHYRQWFDEYAEFIPEQGREHVVANLINIFKAPRREVTTEEQLKAQLAFNWNTIIEGFYGHVRLPSEQV